MYANRAIHTILFYIEKILYNYKIYQNGNNNITASTNLANIENFHAFLTLNYLLIFSTTYTNNVLLLTCKHKTQNEKSK